MRSQCRISVHDGSSRSLRCAPYCRRTATHCEPRREGFEVKVGDPGVLLRPAPLDFFSPPLSQVWSLQVAYGVTRARAA